MGKNPFEPPTPSCQTCRFSMREGDDIVCRRYAPKPSNDWSYFTWPIVVDSDWCGEWSEAF